MAAYDIGDAVTSTTDPPFTNASGNPADPTTVKVYVTNPAGSTTTYTYGVDSQVVHDSLGKFHIDITFTTSGDWLIRWEGEGAATGVVQAIYSVRPNAASDLLNIITLDEAKSGINFDTSPNKNQHDDELRRFITAVSRRLDELCGPIVTRTVTDEPHDGHGGLIFLDHHPVAAVSAVKEYAGTTLTPLTAETVASQTSDQYLFDSRLGILYRRSGGADLNWQTGRANVLVTYTAGRYASTAEVDGKFKTAAALILQELWKPSAGRWAQSFDTGAVEQVGVMPWAAMPRPARELLGDELRAPAVA